ncbi:MAG: hypothetical protein A3F04_00535 [Candidatus Chisholmbacteria bacterium RIFCSPHIGHO2_12_FULL_49_9]|uniref:Glycosyltransferase 2-like domain-containing protein n=1 Tax=Candidatus Chisholmbacteria bacterium RIFCSPHIGHO2_01_FULL_52_32 TaxID=1797591 RepID=A0A1G1VTM0_9BACT|nr:MAG: hypothetical protein A2786_03550 [Candidatus Chisholmbacteria bacterium RIFCSPHIGHO2_01_FULL_52_32]OGY20082.1 MAG: hypothetical protein A2900_03195 [Candidatus Chisholmbacteria bacterium RIFCSPLOWO2_01_FULL_50_28]OGY20984.1 MAG: hypothetical protein A3F04_00535 [Candidatus Chisholmbacteria bacterium RIFCSPHIGHO2_12_FULL_49_9]
MKFSIVIPNYNGAHLLKKNLPEVLKAAGKNEVIVVDDASTDESVELLKAKYPEVRLLVNSKNLRFAKACNRGVQHAKGEIVILLNTDVYPEPNFLTALEPHFNDPGVFAVGCQEMVGEKTRGKAIGRFEKGLLVHAEAKNRTPGPTLWAFGGSAAFRREMWLKLRGMDTLFHPAYWEDIDLSYRAWKRGWEVHFEPQSIVHHEPESTNVSAFGRERIRRIAAKNQILFVWKNIHDPAMIVSHIVWLPWLFLRAVCTSDKAFVAGTLKAFLKFPQAIRKRWKEKRLCIVSDREVLGKFG